MRKSEGEGLALDDLGCGVAVILMSVFGIGVAVAILFILFAIGYRIMGWS